jgi:hypothetical protein
MCVGYSHPGPVTTQTTFTWPADHPCPSPLIDYWLAITRFFTSHRLAWKRKTPSVLLGFHLVPSGPLLLFPSLIFNKLHYTHMSYHGFFHKEFFVNWEIWSQNRSLPLTLWSSKRTLDCPCLSLSKPGDYLCVVDSSFCSLLRGGVNLELREECHQGLAGPRHLFFYAWPLVLQWIVNSPSTHDTYPQAY